MYLTQMGEIPLLTRQQEITLAKKIEITRARFRRKLLECDYVIQIAVKILNRVHRGELPFDRTVQVSVTDRLGKRPNPRPPAAQPADGRNRCCGATRPTIARPLSKSTKMTLRREAWQRLGPAAVAGREAGRRAGPAHPADRAADPHARRIQPPDGRVEGRDRRAQARPALGRRAAGRG